MTDEMRGNVVRLMQRREGITEEEANKAAEFFERFDASLYPGQRPYNWYRAMLATYNAPEPKPCGCGCECCG